jgi:17beta-estradiol 17-dehydrogenase / very-long-chain 3-oxoacyl-CoA reductase
MSSEKRPTLLNPTAESFVRSTLSSIGVPRGAQGRVHEMTPYWSHAIFDYSMGAGGWVGNWFGERLVQKTTSDLRKQLLGSGALQGDSVV